MELSGCWKQNIYKKMLKFKKLDNNFGDRKNFYFFFYFLSLLYERIQFRKGKNNLLARNINQGYDLGQGLPSHKVLKKKKLKNTIFLL